MSNSQRENPREDSNICPPPPFCPKWRRAKVIPSLTSHISHHSFRTTYYAGPKSRAVVRMFFKIFPKLISNDSRSFSFSKTAHCVWLFQAPRIGACSAAGAAKHGFGVMGRFTLEPPPPRSHPPLAPDHLPPRRLLRPRVRVRLRPRRRLRWHPHRWPRCRPGGSPQELSTFPNRNNLCPPFPLPRLLNPSAPAEKFCIAPWSVNLNTPPPNR